jgi:predicted Ser/Thr protein kinase/tetratricopeptide (TPR) repeat protein
VETIGRYRVIRQLGHGGMGHVFLAHDPTLERDVALKFLHHEATRFGLKEEARALAALSHPGIVTVYEIAQHEGQDFIAMEYLRGRSLREVLQDGASRDELLAICGKVGAALAAAHRAGIMHRDIKPENVVVVDDDEVKVVDFGIARRLESQSKPPSQTITAQDVAYMFSGSVLAVAGTDTEISAGTQTMFGTPAYMAPEVLLGEPSTKASDIYSLGIVVYECLVGHRPYGATTLVEVIAQTIEGPPPQLDDPLGELVSRMLSRDPVHRPPLPEIITALRPTAAPAPAPAPASATGSGTAPAVAPPRRWPFAVIAGLGIAAIAALAWWQLTRRPDAPAAAPVVAAAPIVTAAIAVAPIRLEMPSFGGQHPDPSATADTLARLLGETEGARVTGILVSGTSQADGRAAARSVGANYLVTGSIEERDAVLYAELELVSVESGARVAIVQADEPSPKLAALIAVIAGELARTIAPAATLSREPNLLRAQMFFRQGKRFLTEGRFTEARPYFEQAVEADPGFFDAWYDLALTLGWTEAGEHQVLDATARAMALAGPGPKMELMRGVSLYLDRKFAEARAVLEPLDRIADENEVDPRELLYYLGEANWHDGRHAPAFEYFRRALERDQHFGPATIHAWQYTVARRDRDRARYYVGLARDVDGWLEFALGNYHEIASAGHLPHKMWAQLVLGEETTPEVQARLDGDDIDAAAYRIGIAAKHGDLATARAEFAEMWSQRIARQDPDQTAGAFYQLEGLAELVISAGMEPEARQLVAYLAQHSAQRHVRGYHRFTNLAAALLGDPALIVRDGVSERDTTIADASTAELAGNRRRAVAILQALIDDPTFFWDYPERAALARNLRALGRRRELAELCAQTLKPAVFRVAFLALRRVCRR